MVSSILMYTSRDKEENIAIDIQVRKNQRALLEGMRAGGKVALTGLSFCVLLKYRNSPAHASDVNNTSPISPRPAPIPEGIENPSGPMPIALPAGTGTTTIVGTVLSKCKSPEFVFGFMFLILAGATIANYYILSMPQKPNYPPH